MNRRILVNACVLLAGCSIGLGAGTGRPLADQATIEIRSTHEPSANWGDVSPPESSVPTGTQRDRPESATALPSEPGAVVPSGVEARLSIRLELPAASKAINISEPFVVVLTNNSDQPIRVWDPNTEAGYYQLSFHFANSRSRETRVARKRRIQDNGFWKALKQRIEPGSELIDIAPHGDFSVQVLFSAITWGERAWTGLPSPNSLDAYSVYAQFESEAVANSSAQRVWIGKIQSETVTASLIDPRLKTPHDYLRNGFSEGAIELMQDEPKWITARDDDDCTPLHHAARFAHKDAVKWLLDHGADVNAIAYNGFTPLHLTDDLGVIRLILLRKPDLTICCRSQGQTALQRAAEHLANPRRASEREQWRQIVKALLDAGADCDILTAIHLNDLDRVKAIAMKTPRFAHEVQTRSPLRVAASLGRLEICRYLIDDHHVDVNDFEGGMGYPIVKDALEHPAIVRLLIDNGADLKTRINWRGARTGVWIIGDDATALHYAARDGVPETINMLIDNGVDVFATAHDSIDETKKQTALEVAAFFGKADNARAIVGHGRFNAAARELRQALLDKCLQIGAVRWLGQETQRAELIKVLLDKGANPNASENGVSAMQLAARQIHPSSEEQNSEIKRIVGLLAERGADLDLFSAVAIGDEEQVRRLLRRNPASAKSRGPDGYPALHLAVAMNYRNIVAALLKAGADVDIRNKSNNTGYVDETVLHCAAFWGRYEIAQMLLDAGADVNALTARKSTPLHEAARMANVKLTKLLLENGARPDAKDVDGKTPLDWCRDSKWKSTREIEELLRSHSKNDKSANHANHTLRNRLGLGGRGHDYTRRLGHG